VSFTVSDNFERFLYVYLGSVCNENWLFGSLIVLYCLGNENFPLSGDLDLGIVRLSDQPVRLSL
jgi:hypothetical protein